MTGRAWALFASMCVIWGIPYLLIRVAVRAITPADLVFARTAIGAVMLLPIAIGRGQVAAVLRRWRPLAVYSVVEIAIPWVLLSDAETRISSSLAGLLVAAVPLVGVAAVRAGGGRDRITRLRLAGLVAGVAGVAAVVGFDVGHLTGLAVGEMVVVVGGYAAGPQILARRLSDLPSLGVVSCSLALCAIAYAPVLVLQRPASLPSAAVIGAVLTLGVVCTAVAFLLFFRLVAEAGAVRATVITYVNPAVAVALGVTLLHEPFSAGIGIGFALILAGSVLATRRNAPRPAAVRSAGAP